METKGINQVLTLFNGLSSKEQLAIADQINKQTFETRWRILDNDLPDINVSDDEIMKELSSVRYGKTN